MPGPPAILVETTTFISTGMSIPTCRETAAGLVRPEVGPVPGGISEVIRQKAPHGLEYVEYRAEMVDSSRTLVGLRHYGKCPWSVGCAQFSQTELWQIMASHGVAELCDRDGEIVVYGMIEAWGRMLDEMTSWGGREAVARLPRREKGRGTMVPGQNPLPESRRRIMFE